MNGGTIRGSRSDAGIQEYCHGKTGAGTFVCEKVQGVDDLGLACMENKVVDGTWWTYVSSMSQKSLPWPLVCKEDDIRELEQRCPGEEYYQTEESHVKSDVAFHSE